MTALIRLQRMNPIEWQETRLQLRTAAGRMKRYRLLIPAGIGVLILLIVLSLRAVSSPTRELAIYLIWTVHAMTAAIALAAGSNALSREHVGKTWDSLVLTGVSIRQIVLGKWLGVLHRAAPWLLLLGGVRLVMLPILLLAFVNRYAWRNSYGGYGYAYGGPPLLEWVPWATVLAVVMTVVLSALEIMACSAIGLAAGAVIKRGWLAMIAAVCIRFAPVVLFGAFTRYEVGPGPSWRVLRFPPLALADGGSAPLYQLALPLSGWTSTAHENALPGLVMATLMLISLLVGGLAVTWWFVHRAGALPKGQPVSAAA